MIVSLVFNICFGEFTPFRTPTSWASPLWSPGDWVWEGEGEWPCSSAVALQSASRWHFQPPQPGFTTFVYSACSAGCVCEKGEKYVLSGVHTFTGVSHIFVPQARSSEPITTKPAHRENLEDWASVEVTRERRGITPWGSDGTGG